MELIGCQFKSSKGLFSFGLPNYLCMAFDFQKANATSEMNKVLHDLSKPFMVFPGIKPIYRQKWIILLPLLKSFITMHHNQNSVYGEGEGLETGSRNVYHTIYSKTMTALCTVSLNLQRHFKMCRTTCMLQIQLTFHTAADFSENIYTSKSSTICNSHALNPSRL